jgi:hypothetical protein
MLDRMVGNLHFSMHLDSKRQSIAPGGSLPIENQLFISEHLLFNCSNVSRVTGSHILSLPGCFRLSQWPSADVDPGPTALTDSLIFWSPLGSTAAVHSTLQ